MKQIRVDLPQSAYSIVIGENLLNQAGEYLRQWTQVGEKLPHCIVVTDTNVEPLYAQAVGNALAESGAEVDLCVVEAGEESKCVEVVSSLWERCIECGADRRTVLVAVGGGVVGDLTGFAAASLLRGVRFVQVPTSLLAMVDSSVGGKTGINLPQGKNLVGAFWQPIGVLADTRTLATLDERQYRSGLAEVVKYGVILDADFFAWLENHVPEILAHDDAVLTHIVSRCCELKAQIVLEDERETSGRRALLNYGHTFGHAVEKLCGYGTVLHGEGVGIGMMYAARLAQSLHPERTQLEELCQRQENLLKALGIPTEAPQLDHASAVAVMKHDKKAQNGEIRFILPKNLGDCELEPVIL